MADGEFDWLPGAGGAAWTLREAAPCDACVTRYDQEHFLTYARLIDAARFGIDWREAASEILLCNVEQAPERTRRCWQSHLARAHWTVRDSVRKSVVKAKSVSVSVELGGRRMLNKKN